MKNILLVDDELEMLNSLEKILSTRKDFKTKKIQNPNEAIRLVKLNKYDIIITDLKMKG